ncbi:MAG: hypothetical protein AAGM22_06985 [Acidobacteriota bacterium]
MNSVMARFQAAIELHEMTIAMQKMRLIREHPGATPEQINEWLEEWVTGRDSVTATARQPPP